MYKDRNKNIFEIPDSELPEEVLEYKTITEEDEIPVMAYNLKELRDHIDDLYNSHGNNGDCQLDYDYQEGPRLLFVFNRYETERERRKRIDSYKMNVRFLKNKSYSV